MPSAKKALTKLGEAFAPPLYRSDQFDSDKLPSSHTHPFSPSPFAAKTTTHDQYGRAKVKNGKNNIPMVETGGPVDGRESRTDLARARSTTMPNLLIGLKKRHSPEPVPKVESKTLERWKAETKKAELKKDAWISETRPEVFGGWKPEYSVFSHLDEQVGEVRKSVIDGGGGSGRGDERVYEVFEVAGSAVGSLLHSLRAEIRERKMLERSVEDLEERIEKLEGGGKKGMGHGGGEGEMRDWFARQERAVEAREFL